MASNTKMSAQLFEREKLEAELDSADRECRSKALDTLVRTYGTRLPPEGQNVNMHMHSFFSYNADDHTPSRLAWEARCRGLYAAALSDFDVLDGLEEFYTAGLVLGLRTAVHVETRVFLPEYHNQEINSPREQGVSYMMACGVPFVPDRDSSETTMLTGLRTLAAERNKAVVTLINRSFGQIAVDYEKEVLPLTPAGAPTERHIVKAYIRKARQVFPTESDLARFWSEVLKLDVDLTIQTLAEPVLLEDTVRSGLVKKSGLGCFTSMETLFVSADDFIGWSRACGAIPTWPWLDGTTTAEREPDKLLECLRGKGIMAINIIPERNWNVADPEQRKIKRMNLDAIVRLAEAMQMPINIGTELNRRGLPFVDDLDGEVLRQYRLPFQRGARIMVGHAVLARYARFGYASERALAEFPDPGERNAFFEAVGGLPPLTMQKAEGLLAVGFDRAFDRLYSAAKAAGWRRRSKS